MSTKKGPAHVVVDGSNIATEGRSMPSLAQLQEAVMSFIEENPGTAVTVVVDATFGHRIDKKEAKAFEEGIANNELVAPPAGAVGRGDAFVLGIADKAGAAVLSNDSFQEFHGQYEWLFDEGRLIGGKPVPHVGWVWVDRVPVRGPVSRKATRARGGSTRGGSGRSGRRASKAASEPMPVPSSPPPRTQAAAPTPDNGNGAARSSRRPAPKGSEPVNELIPFLDFVEHHPVGTSVNGTVDAYSSHGAYITVAESNVRVYVPLRMMAEPPPRSAKQVMKIGESVTIVVVSFAAQRRSIDCAVPDMAERAIAAVAAAAEDESAADPDSSDGPSTSSDAAPTQAADRPETAKAATKAKAGARKRAAKKTAAKKSAAKKTAAEKSAAKKTAAKKTAPEKTGSKKTAAKKSAAKKSAARKTAADKTGSKKTAAKKSAAKKSAAKKTAAKKSAANTSTAEKSGAKRSTSRKKSAAKKQASAKGQTAGEQAAPAPADTETGAG